MVIVDSSASSDADEADEDVVEHATCDVIGTQARSQLVV
jgi:hypothetical protein